MFEQMNKETPCGTCPKPILDHENVQVWELYQVLSGQLIIGGMGTIIGLNFPAIHFVFEVYDIPRELWMTYFERLIVIDNAVGKFRNQKPQHTNKQAHPSK